MGHRLQQEEVVMRNLIRALIAASMLATLPVVSQAGLFVAVSVGIPPPALPVYVQPPCPSPGYIWVPGYWAWDDGYYWVPGTWMLAPAAGLLWTPGYWGWSDGAYLWHEGYWGRHVGFYGGINYGFGYSGVGYEGGYWRGHDFYYNRAVTNVGTTRITNVYQRSVVNDVSVNRVSFNGGTGGVRARPTAADITAGRESHRGLTPMQRQQAQVAQTNQSMRAARNGGRPAVAATSRPGVFSGHDVVAARGAGRLQTTSHLQGTNDGATAHETSRHLAAARAPLPRAASAPEVRSTYQAEQRAHQAAPHAPGAGPQTPGGYEATARRSVAYPQGSHSPPEGAAARPPSQSHAAVPPHAAAHAPAYAPPPAHEGGGGHERAAPEKRPEHAERGL
jgi:hypothetical protein